MMKKLRVGLIVDEGEQPYLNFDLYRRSLDSDCYSIEYLIVQKSVRPHTENALSKLIHYVKKKGLGRLVARIGFAIIETIESRIVRRSARYADFFSVYPLSQFDVSKIYVTPVISPSGLVYRYSEEDLKKVRDLGLDTLVRGGGGIFRGDILTVCPFGIISFHHADNDINRGGPPGFWEVFNREASTGFVIQRLLNELDGGDVLFKGSIATSFLYKLNVCRLYLKSSVFLHKTLERLAQDPDGLSVYPKSPYSFPLYTTPTISQILAYLLKTLFCVFKKTIGKWAGKSLRWGVAYQFTEQWRSAVLWKSIVIQNPPFRFLADPFVVTHHNRTVVFVEDYDYRICRGKISAYDINASGYTELGTALEEPSHLSYPFIFRVDGDLYMMPETHGSRDIRIYKCVDFPLQWTLHKVIMDGVSAADSSIFKLGGTYWLMTNLDSSNLDDHSSELHIFSADSFDSTEWRPHPMNPVIFDSKRGRNGGLIVSDDGIYRVFQTQGFDLYGASMGVSKITVLTTERYEEEVLFDISPNFMKGILGTHTFSFDSGVLCLDFVKYENKC